MKTSKFTESQIIFAIKQSETGVKTDEICRKMGISQATFFNWKKKFGGLGLTELRKLKQLEEENNQLKKLVAELSLDKQMLQEVIKKKALSPSQRRDISFWLIDEYRISVRRACRCMLLSSSMFYYRPADKDDDFLRLRITEIAKTRIRYEFWRIFVLLRREGFTDNHKRVYRIYKEEGLNLRTKRPRRNRAGAHRLERVENNSVNKVWSMDFVQDALFDRSKFRILSIVDNFSKKCHSLAVGQSMKGADVVDQLEHLKVLEGLIPERIQCDNGSEFISKEVDRWAYENGVILDFSRPGKPTDNPYVESFNGKFRDECLSVNWFLSLDDARTKINSWRDDYNFFRPHSSLDDLTPEEFINLHSKYT